MSSQQEGKKESAVAVILAGGKSSRMGKDKALLPWAGRPVIAHIVEEMKKITEDVVIVTNQPSVYQFLNLPTLSDRYKDSGPLGGLETALYHLPGNFLYLTACDMPFASQDIYGYLKRNMDSHQAVIPVYEDRAHPLAGIYHASILPELQHCLDQGQLKVRQLLDRIDTLYISDFPGFSTKELENHFFNMNYPEQYNQLGNQQ